MIKSLQSAFLKKFKLHCDAGEEGTGEEEFEEEEEEEEIDMEVEQTPAPELVRRPSLSLSH